MTENRRDEIHVGFCILQSFIRKHGKKGVK